MPDLYTPPSTLEGYAELNRRVEGLRSTAPQQYREVKRQLCRLDLFYLARYVSLVRFGRKFLTALDGSGRPEERCILDAPVAIKVARRMESLGNKTLYVGGRGLLKSTFHGLEVIRQVLVDQQVKILILASTKELAMRSVSKVMVEIDQNQELRELFPDIFWASKTEARRAGVSWSPKGLVVKRIGGHRECTVDPAGCLDGLPIGVHYHRVMGDDMEEPKNVTLATLPHLLAVIGKIPPLTTGHGAVWNTIGTYHHARGLHTTGLPEAGWNVLEMPSVDTEDIPDGYIEIPFGSGKRKVWWHEIGGRPIYDTAEFLADKFISLREVEYGAQYLCRKPNEVNRRLDARLIRWYEAVADAGNLNASRLSHEVLYGSQKVLLVDPAHAKGKVSSDPTCMLVVGLYRSGTTRMVIILDAYYSPRLARPGRLYVAMEMISKWNVKQVRWEAFGAVEDHLELLGYMKSRGRDTRGIRVVPYTTRISKNIRALEAIQPLLQTGDLWAPKRLLINGSPAPNEREGVPAVQQLDFAQLLVEEFDQYPDGPDHILDCLGMVSEANSKQGRLRRPPLEWGDTSDPPPPKELPRHRLASLPSAPFMI